MMRSLFSGVSGLKVHQTKMDVIGNNIANVNTIGFKSSSVNFSDVFYQTTQNASGPNANTGSAGTNAMQIGLGADLAAITVNVTGTGSTQRTDRALDLMINGDAFFVVNVDGSNYFTKSGALNVDAAGNLYCTSNGGTVMGWQVDANENIVKDTVTPLKVMSPDKVYSLPTATTDITLIGNIDKFDPAVTSDNGYIVTLSFYDQTGKNYMAKVSIKQSDKPGETNKYNVTIKDILDSNSKSILKTPTVDENGVTTYTSTNQYVNFGDKELAYEVLPSGDINWTGSIDEISSSLIFNGSTGAFTSVSGEDGKTLKLNLNKGEANNAFPIQGVDIDFSHLTSIYKNGSSNIEPQRGDFDGGGAGNPAGSLTGVTIQGDGRIYGVYDNNTKRLFGQIAVATFANPSGLESVGSSLFASTQNSGEFDGVGLDPSTTGSLTVGALEMSNVDLSNEFTSMITTQRGFQANSRIITTSDSLLEELINLKR